MRGLSDTARSALVPYFWSRVDVRGSKDCWPWRLSKNSCGYGSGGVLGQSFSAHRLAWELTNGEIPEGLRVCHTCDNPPCCNPSHLFLGTQKQNMTDAASKKRLGKARGGKQWKSKLSNNEAIELKKILRYRTKSQEFVGKLYGLSQASISGIERGAVRA